MAMKRLFIILMLLCGSVQAFEVVYPKNQNVTINADKTFFIGNGDLTINGQKVNIHPSGGFKYAVNLNIGSNKFVLQNGKQKQIFTITRPKPSLKENNAKIVNYDIPFVVKTSSDNVALRSTPVDFGLNRLQHLTSGIDLPAVGEYGDFYKTQLARDDFGWVAKSQVEILKKDFLPAVIYNLDYENNDEAQIFTFKIDNKKIPYVLTENKSGFDLFLYGLNDNIYPYGKYEFPIAQDDKNFGYTSYYDKDELVVKINKYKPSLKGLKITIDAGHGGSELGAIGCLGDKEKDVNLKIALKLKDKLSKAGAQVFMTRENDKAVGLQERVNYTNTNNSQIFISIHNNALPDNLADKEVTGTEVYYFYPQAKELAQLIAEGINAKTGLKNNGAKGGSFAVIRNTNAVSVLVECAYMIVPDDNAKLQDDAFLDKISNGILEGLENYLK